MRRLKTDTSERKNKTGSRDYKCNQCGHTYSSGKKACCVRCPKCGSKDYRFASNRNLKII